MKFKLNINTALKTGLLLCALASLCLIPGCAEEATMEYVGDTKGGLPHGRGTLTYFEGPTYSGDFYEGKRHGKGIWMHQDGTTYDGEWKNDLYHGRGILEIPFHFSYEGEFVEGKKEGFGIQTWAEGNRYEGNWHDDQMHGQGIMYYADGSRYSGEWEYSQKSGRGAMVTAEDEIIRGEWEGNVHVAFPLENISLGLEEIILKQGDPTYELKLTTYPPNAELPDIEWASSDPNIVHVEEGMSNEIGRITAVSTGRAFVTAKTVVEEGEIQTWCWVEVVTPYTAETRGTTITSLRLEPASMTMRVGDEQKSFNVVVTPSGASTGNLRWGSSRENIAIVSSTGLIRPLRPGRTVITVLTPDGRVRATADLFVMGSLD